MSALQRYFDSLASNHRGELGTYSDRMSNLCLVEMERFDEAIRNYENRLEELDNRDQHDYLYYAIDLAYAELAQIKHHDGDEGDAAGKSRNILAVNQRMKINRLMAQLNGMPLPDGSDELIPTDHCIVSSRPNPFNSSTTVDYVLTEAVFTSLKVYDLNGRLVNVLHSEYTKMGRHSIVWNATDMPSGVYVCRLEAGKVCDDVKLVIVR